VKYTSHLNLKKPEYTDTRDIEDIDDNMDAIDSAIWGLQNVGSPNAGKFMVVDNSGNVVPTTVPFANGGTY